MIRYETLILATPEITSTESSEIEKQFEQIVKKNGGAIRSFERWGKYKLAYPVRKNDYGVYFLTRFEGEKDHVGTILQEIDPLFKLKFPQIVMRFMNTRLAADGPLEYQRPDSLEEDPAATEDVDTFLRKHKIGGSREKGAPRSRPFTKPSDTKETKEPAVQSQEAELVQQQIKPEAVPVETSSITEHEE